MPVCGPFSAPSPQFGPFGVFAENMIFYFTFLLVFALCALSPSRGSVNASVFFCSIDAYVCVCVCALRPLVPTKDDFSEPIRIERIAFAIRTQNSIMIFFRFLFSHLFRTLNNNKWHLRSLPVQCMRTSVCLCVCAFRMPYAYSSRCRKILVFLRNDTGFREWVSDARVHTQRVRTRSNQLSIFRHSFVAPPLVFDLFK